MKKVREGYKMTELGEIPEEWEIVNLSQLSDKIGDGLHGTPKYDDNGDYYFINGNNLVSGKIVLSSDTKKVSEDEYLKNKKDLNVNTLLVSLNGTIGNVAYYQNEQIMLGKSSGYIILKESVNKKYMYYILKSNKTIEYFNKELTGTTIKNLSLNAVRNTPIPLATTQEQQKIASILSTVDEQIDNVDGLIEKNKELKKGLMQQLLTKGIGHTKFKKTELGEIPNEWNIMKLSEVAEIVMGQSPDSSSYNDIGDGVAFFQGKTEFGRINPVVKKWCNNPTKISKPLDILISVRAPVGDVNINNIEACIGRGLGAIRQTDKSNYKYLYYAIQKYNNQLQKASQGSTFEAINSNDLKGLKLPMPLINEQEKIASILSKIDKKIEEYENKKQKLEELKKGLMQQLLTGKIRVV